MTMIENGTKSVYAVLDEHGSSRLTIRHLREGKPIGKVRISYEWRKPVHSEQEEHEEYLQFSARTMKDSSMREPSFKLEGLDSFASKGFYYIVRCWYEIV